MTAALIVGIHDAIRANEEHWEEVVAIQSRKVIALQKIVKQSHAAFSKGIVLGLGVSFFITLGVMFLLDFF